MTSLAKKDNTPKADEDEDIRGQLRKAKEELERMRTVEAQREAERVDERRKLQALEAKLAAYEGPAYDQVGDVVGSEPANSKPNHPPALRATSLANVTNKPKANGRSKAPKADGGMLAAAPPSGGYALCEPADSSQPTNPSRAGTPKDSSEGRL